MSKYFDVSFSYLEPVLTKAVVEGNSEEEVVDKIRNYFSHSVNLEIHEVTLLDDIPEEAKPPRGKPNLRLVN